MANPYAKTANVTKLVTDARAIQYNSVLSELRAGLMDFQIDAKASIAFTYNGLLPATMVITDTESDENNIACTRTFAWTGFKLNTTVDVYPVTGLNITVTTTYTYSGIKLTGISRAIT